MKNRRKLHNLSKMEMRIGIGTPYYYIVFMWVFEVHFPGHLLESLVQSARKNALVGWSVLLLLFFFPSRVFCRETQLYCLDLGERFLAARFAVPMSISSPSVAYQRSLSRSVGVAMGDTRGKGIAHNKPPKVRSANVIDKFIIHLAMFT